MPRLFRFSLPLRRPATVLASIGLGWLLASSASADTFNERWAIDAAPAGGRETPYDTAGDAGGNLIVTYFSNSTIRTVKYAAADGSVLWEQRHQGVATGGGDASPQALALDASGNVFVTGYTWNGVSDDLYTVKYAADDGRILWEQTYDGPAHEVDEGRLVAVDAAGDVLVAATSGLCASSDEREGRQGTDLDIYLVKCAGADGTPLWEKRVAGTGGMNDVPTALLACPSGDATRTMTAGWLPTPGGRPLVCLRSPPTWSRPAFLPPSLL